MGLLDRLLGRLGGHPRPQRGYAAYPVPQPPPEHDRGWASPRAEGRPTPDADDRAIERYRYLLRTAPPETIEQAHAEAFAQLSPAQRQQVLVQLAAEVPERERSGSDDPWSLARMATRAEMRNPGTLERSLGGRGMAGGVAAGGIGMGGLVAGSLLASVAGAFIGTSIAAAMVDTGAGWDGGDAGDAYAGGEYGSGGDGGGEYGGGDYGSGDYGGGDLGGDFGGDFGGGF